MNGSVGVEISVHAEEAANTKILSTLRILVLAAFILIYVILSALEILR